MINLLIGTYLIGNLVFTTMADFNKVSWCEAYYVWQNVSFGGVFAWGAIYNLSKGLMKNRVRYVFYFSVIMMLWNLARLFVNIDVNHSAAVMIAFILLILITSYLTLNPEGRAAKFLNKHLLG